MPEEVKIELVQNSEEEIVNVTIPIVCLGTGEHSSEVQSLLTSFYKRIGVGEDVFPHLINGIGSAPVEGKIGGEIATENDLLREFATRPMLGTYDPKFTIDGNNKVKVDITTTGPASGLRQAYAQFTGEGYENAFDEIMALYKAVKDHCEKKYPGKKIHYTFPMTGFSRGANICKEIPNFFDKMLDDDEQENISFYPCLFDPVPGGSRIDNEWSQKFPKTVKEAWVVLSKDEPNHVVFQESNKKRDTIEDPEKTTVHYLMLGGKHADPQCPEVSDPEREPGPMSSGILARDALLSCCAASGLKLDGKLGVTYLDGQVFKEYHIDGQGEAIDDYNNALSDAQKLALYTQQILAEPLFDARYERTFLRPFKGLRRELREKELYFLHGTTYFSDKQHMTMFAKLYPAFFDFFFQKNVAGATEKEVLEDFLAICRNKALLTSLEIAKIIPPEMEQKALNFVEKNKDTDPNITKLANLKTNIFGTPKGIPVDHKTFYSNKTLMILKDRVLEIINAVKLGRDTSVSKSLADKVYLGLMKILKDKTSEEEKIFLIKTYLGKLTLVPRYANTDFVLKMTGLINDSSINAASALVMLQHAGNSILKYSNRNPEIQGRTDEFFAQIEQTRISISLIHDEEYDANGTLSREEFDQSKTQRINETIVRFQYKNLVTLSQREYDEKRELQAAKTKATQAGVQDQTVLRHQAILAKNYYRNLNAITQKVIGKTQAFMAYQKIDKEPADEIIKSLSAYLNRFNWFRNKELSDHKAAIAKKARVAFMHLKSVNKGSDLILLKQALLELQVESRATYLAAGKGPGELDALVQKHLDKINKGINAQANRNQKAQVANNTNQSVEAADKKESEVSAEQHDKDVKGLKRHSFFLERDNEEAPAAKRPKFGR